MQREIWRAEQGELADKSSGRTSFIPRVRPTADAELEETFVRAAAAWAKWKERRKWAGR